MTAAAHAGSEVLRSAEGTAHKVANSRAGCRDREANRSMVTLTDGDGTLASIVAKLCAAEGTRPENHPCPEAEVVKKCRPDSHGRPSAGRGGLPDALIAENPWASRQNVKTNPIPELPPFIANTPSMPQETVSGRRVDQSGASSGGVSHAQRCGEFIRILCRALVAPWHSIQTERGSSKAA